MPTHGLVPGRTTARLTSPPRMQAHSSSQSHDREHSNAIGSRGHPAHDGPRDLNLADDFVHRFPYDQDEAHSCLDETQSYLDEEHSFLDDSVGSSPTASSSVSSGRDDEDNRRTVERFAYYYMSRDQVHARRSEAVSCVSFIDCRRRQDVEHQRRLRASSSLDDEEEDIDTKSRVWQLPLVRRRHFETLDRLPVNLAKKTLLARLEEADGEPRNKRVAAAVEVLAAEWKLWNESDESLSSPASALRQATGRWEALTRADFPGSVGRNKNSKAYTYTLGRMSFGLFSPGDVVLSVERCTATCRPLDLFERPLSVPDSFAHLPRSQMRSYNIEVRFVVTDDRAPGLAGTITTYGYCVAGANRAPDASHRLDVWFVAGDLRPDKFDSRSDADKWAALFGTEATQSRQKRSLVTRASLWFVSVALGIQLAPVEPEGVQCYTVARPISGHVDVLFTDGDLRITRGNRSSLVVMRRLGSGNNIMLQNASWQHSY